MHPHVTLLTHSTRRLRGGKPRRRFIHSNQGDAEEHRASQNVINAQKDVLAPLFLSLPDAARLTADHQQQAAYTHTNVQSQTCHPTADRHAIRVTHSIDRRCWVSRGTAATERSEAQLLPLQRGVHAPRVSPCL